MPLNRNNSRGSHDGASLAVARVFGVSVIVPNSLLVMFWWLGLLLEARALPATPPVVLNGVPLKSNPFPDPRLPLRPRQRRERLGFVGDVVGVGGVWVDVVIEVVSDELKGCESKWSNCNHLGSADYLEFSLQNHFGTMDFFE